MNVIQYTIRNIPPALDRVIRKRAKEQGRSFNQTVVDLLNVQVFGTTTPQEDKKFDWLFNQKTLDTRFDEAIAELSQIDEELWVQ